MAIVSLQSPTVLLSAVVGIGWILYTLYTRYSLEQRRKAFKLQHGCKEPPPNRRPWDIFGLCSLYELLKAAGEHRLLDYWDNNFKLYGTTHGGRRRGRRFAITMDVENFKAIHATKFDDW